MAIPRMSRCEEIDKESQAHCNLAIWTHCDRVGSHRSVLHIKQYLELSRCRQPFDRSISHDHQTGCIASVDVGAEYPYDVVADGQRFLAFAPAREAESPSITVMLNWHAGLSDSGK